jgi:hypothetical protein
LKSYNPRFLKCTTRPHRISPPALRSDRVGVRRRTHELFAGEARGDTGVAASLRN